MALKFLNKKGWHTGSLANIERVWKKEQVHKEEQRKLEEFKKQIAEEAEKAEFRQLQIDAGLVPRQERVDFLYEPGVSKGEGFKTLEAIPPKAEADAAAVAAAAAASAGAAAKAEKQQPGALFEEKPQSANDTWRKLHSDPLLMIKQREQEALARIKNNPVQMAKLKKSVEEKKEKKKKKKEDKKHKHKSAKRDKDSEKYSSEDRSDSEFEEKRKNRGHDKSTLSRGQDYDEDRSRRGRDHRSDSEVEENRERRYDKYSSEKYTITRDKERSVDEERNTRGRHYSGRKDDQYRSGDRVDSENEERRDKRRYDRYSFGGYGSEKYVNGRDGERDRSKRDRSEERDSEKYVNGRYDRYSSRGHGSEKYVNGRDGERDRSRGDRSEERDLGKRHHRIDKKDELRSSNARPDSDSEENRKRSVEKKKDEMHSPPRMEASNTNLGRPYQKQRRVVTKLSEEEKAARLKEMQMDAVLHEEQRWNRLKKASENDAKEANQAISVGGSNFLNAAQKSVYGAEKGGSSTVEESVRRRKYFSQGRSDANEGNAFRR